MIQRIVAACAVAALLVCAPSRLAAAQREGPTTDQAAVREWFSGTWGALAAWWTGKIVQPPPPGAGGGPITEGSCAVDPFGCPDGG